MMETSGFSFSSNTDKTDWAAKADRLVERLDCLGGLPAVKNFMKFLEIPYLHVGKRHAKAFRCILKKYGKPDVKPVRVADLLLAVYSTNDYERHGHKALKLIDELCGQVDRFMAHQHLDSQPSAVAQFAAESLRDKGKPFVYNELVTKWQRHASRLPIGRSYFYQNWAAADAAHFSLDVTKDKPYHGNFADASAKLQAYQEHELSIYALENGERSKLFGEEKAPHTTESDSKRLLSIYGRLVGLLNQSEITFSDYIAHKADFLAIGESVDWRTWVSLFIATQNALVKLKRQSNDHGVREELFFWTKKIMESGRHKELPTISKSFYLNRLNYAFLFGDLELAYDIIEELEPRIPVDTRPWASYVAEIGLSFHCHFYKKVVSAVRAKHGAAGKNVFIDQLRLKSYLLRACMCLLVNDPTLSDETQAALEDFRIFINRHQLGEMRKLELSHFYEACRDIVRSVNRDGLAEDANDLRKSIRSRATIMSKGWLLNFLDEVGNARGDEDFRVTSLRRYK